MYMNVRYGGGVAAFFGFGLRFRVAMGMRMNMPEEILVWAWIPQ